MICRSLFLKEREIQVVDDFEPQLAQESIEILAQRVTGAMKRSETICETTVEYKRNFSSENASTCYAFFARAGYQPKRFTATSDGDLPIVV